MVLPHAEERQTEPVRELRLLDHVAHRLRMAHEGAVRAERAIAESVETDFERSHTLDLVPEATNGTPVGEFDDVKRITHREVVSAANDR
jgi:hypothetical protein